MACVDFFRIRRLVRIAKFLRRLTSLVLLAEQKMEKRVQAPLHVEVIHKASFVGCKIELAKAVEHFLRSAASITSRGDVLLGNEIEPFIKANVDSIRLCNDNRSSSVGQVIGECTFVTHVYKLDRLEGQMEDIADEDNVHAATMWVLPNLEFDGLWEALVFDSNVKTSLLRYVETTLLLSDMNVNPHKISWNKVVLLHGPPGTGKTSLCRALAHKLSIRLGSRFSYGQLIEINSHSLFSKWFAESGKLVQRMFEQIMELVNDPKAFVCLLIDEVESLTAARKSSANEPSDAIRVVNAVLTQLDNIKRCPNVLVLTTSNITGRIDLAFVDRADIKQYIGPPSREAAYAMLQSGLDELVSKNVVSHVHLLGVQELQEVMASSNPDLANGDEYSSHSRRLFEIAGRCAGMSGRTLIKLPFHALTRLIDGSGARCFKVDDFLVALEQAIAQYHEDMENLDSTSETVHT